MATKYWIGRAAAVAQVSTITVGGTIAPGDKFSVTINGKSVTFTATTTTIAHVVAGLVDLLNATTAPIEHGELTWVASSPTIVGTADVAGVPHTITVSETGAASTLAIATTVAATGPNFEDNPENWVGGVAPTTDDYLVFDSGSVSVKYGWVKPADSDPFSQRKILPGYTGNIGLPATNELGYPEYRQRWPLVVAYDVDIYGSGQYLMVLSDDVKATVRAGTVEFHYITPVTANVYVRIEAGATVILAEAEDGLTIAEILNLGTLYVSPANTFSPTITLITSAGTAEIYKATTARTRGGTLKVQKATTLQPYSGTIVLLGPSDTTGTTTITNVVVGPDTADGEDGTLDLSQSMTPVAITNLTLNGRGAILDPHQRLTGTHTLTINASKITAG